MLLQIANRLTIEMFKSIDLVSSNKMLNDMFVDDLVTGGELPEEYGDG